MNRIALIGIVVSQPESVEKLNELLHAYAPFVVGRMGLPMRERGISLISVALDAPQTEIASLSGKLGMLQGVSVKTIYATKEAEA